MEDTPSAEAKALVRQACMSLSSDSEVEECQHPPRSYQTCGLGSAVSLGNPEHITLGDLDLFGEQTQNEPCPQFGCGGGDAEGEAAEEVPPAPGSDFGGCSKDGCSGGGGNTEGDAKDVPPAPGSGHHFQPGATVSHIDSSDGTLYLVKVIGNHDVCGEPYHTVQDVHKEGPSFAVPAASVFLHGEDGSNGSMGLLPAPTQGRIGQTGSAGGGAEAEGAHNPKLPAQKTKAKARGKAKGKAKAKAKAQAKAQGQAKAKSNAKAKAKAKAKGGGQGRAQGGRGTEDAADAPCVGQPLAAPDLRTYKTEKSAGRSAYARYLRAHPADVEGARTACRTATYAFRAQCKPLDWQPPTQKERLDFFKNRLAALGKHGHASGRDRLKQVWSEWSQHIGSERQLQESKEEAILKDGPAETKEEAVMKDGPEETKEKAILKELDETASSPLPSAGRRHRKREGLKKMLKGGVKKHLVHKANKIDKKAPCPDAALTTPQKGGDTAVVAGSSAEKEPAPADKAPAPGSLLELIESEKAVAPDVGEPASDMTLDDLW